jgi:glycosyltransferase involved in cell wall biosynthesis
LAKKKILVVMRHDSKYRPGGDTMLLLALSKCLIDFQCKTVVGVPNNVKGFDYVLCANLDRPIEANQLLNICQRDHVPFHLMTLHHSYTEISKFLEFGLFGWKRILAMSVRYRPIYYEQCLWFLRVITSYFSRGVTLKHGNVRKSQLALLKNSELLLVVSKDELKMIEKDIGIVSSEIVEVPHILEGETIKQSEEKRIIFCPGRIESRKNQLFILRVAKHLHNFKFVFMGRLNYSESSYCKKFMKNVNELENVSYLEPKEISEFRQYLLSSDIVLTASWFEVTSLIELDVLKNGKKLVTCSKSYNHSFFLNPFTFKAHDINECAEVIIKASKIENYQINGCYPYNDKIIKGYIDSL